MRNTFWLAALLFAACATSPERAYQKSLESEAEGCPELDDGISEVSPDTTYAFSKDNPVKVSGGPRNEKAYLGMLIGPGGRAVTDYYREGSVDGKEAILDQYTIIVEGDTLRKPIYLDMYNCDNPKAPFGFGIKGRAEVDPDGTVKQGKD